ncbi:MAG: nucleotide exchange factor GrpE [Methylococcales bacterium]|nr:nucleotide exchange factor GrpE [Methylococcales bacterium]
MSSEIEKNELLNEFRHFLEQDIPGQKVLQNQPDLHTLLSEMTELKTEVKVEARHYKNSLDIFSSVLKTVQEDNKALIEELALYKQKLEQQQFDIKKGMLLDMVELYDRLNAGVKTLQHYRPISSLFKKSRPKDVRFIERFMQGQNMSIKRFEQCLQSYQVQTIDCVGKSFDPKIMSALETGYNLSYGNGIVLEELQKGFIFNDQVLRLADVKVNKLHPLGNR